MVLTEWAADAKLMSQCLSLFVLGESWGIRVFYIIGISKQIYKLLEVAEWYIEKKSANFHETQQYSTITMFEIERIAFRNSADIGQPGTNRLRLQYFLQSFSLLTPRTRYGHGWWRIVQ
jgi:hypothetical protein